MNKNGMIIIIVIMILFSIILLLMAFVDKTTYVTSKPLVVIKIEVKNYNVCSYHISQFGNNSIKEKIVLNDICGKYNLNDKLTITKIQ